MSGEIAREAAEGKSLDELAERAEELKKRIKIFVSVSTFKYMVRGGRVSPLTGMVATALNLKPIISLDETGKGVKFDKSFSAKGLMKKVLKIAGDIDNARGIASYAIVHAADEKKAAHFARQLEDATGKKPDYITSISPIVGMHSGKGAVAIGIIEGK